VNVSGWDFTIEDCEDGSATIRFGLGAVKNVGHAPVDAILQGRKERPFTDLNDFAHCVDLRQVGKRSLECLIKVGALDRFGPRQALLEGLDRIIAVSASHFRAADMGQMSLFGVHTGVAEDIVLPTVTSEVNRREVLNWERELIGLYISDHPLSPVMDSLTQAVSHFSGQLSEGQPNERVRVAGLIVRIRHHQSKAGKPMGFVTLEDIQGTIDLVVFPSVWARVEPIMEYDRIVLVEGRIDASGAEPKVLVDNITTDFSLVVSADSQTVQTKPAARQITGQTTGVEKPSVTREEVVLLEDDYPASALAEEETALAHPIETDFAPPEPEYFPPESDLFPPGWDEVSLENASIGALAATIFTEELSDVPLTAPTETTTSVTPAATEESPAEKPLILPPFLVSPVVVPDIGKVHMITVVLRSTGDRTRDVLRLRRIHGTVMSYPGNDRFAFQVFERGRGYLVEFPNFTTGYNPELISKLNLLVGVENVRVEPITFQ